MKSSIKKLIFVMVLIALIPSGVFSKDFTVTNSAGMKSLYNYKNSMGLSAGLSCFFSVGKSVELGLGYQYTISEQSPELEQYVSTEELAKIHHFTQNEFSLLARIEMIRTKFYQLKIMPGLLINSYSDGFIVQEYFIDAETGFKAYTSNYLKGVNYGLNASIINVFKVSDRISIGLLTGVSLYQLTKYNSFIGEFEIAYKFSKHK